jgi:hypothetical protein
MKRVLLALFTALLLIAARPTPRPQPDYILTVIGAPANVRVGQAFSCQVSGVFTDRETGKRLVRLWCAKR